MLRKRLKSASCMMSIRAYFGKTFNFAKIGEPTSYKSEISSFKAKPRKDKEITQLSLVDVDEQNTPAFEKYDKLIGYYDNFKELVVMIGDQLIEINDTATYKLVMFKLHGAMLKVNRKQRVNTDDKVKIALEAILLDIPNRAPSFHIDTMTTVLGFLSQLYSKTGLVSPNLNKAIRAVSDHLVKYVANTEKKIPPGMLITNIQSYSYLNYSFKDLLEPLEKNLLDTESELRLNILSFQSAGMYFRAIDPSLRYCPMAYSNYYEEYRKIANVGIILGNVIETLIGEAKLYDACRLLRIIATLRIEVFSNNHMVRYYDVDT